MGQAGLTQLWRQQLWRGKPAADKLLSGVRLRPCPHVSPGVPLVQRLSSFPRGTFSSCSSSRTTGQRTITASTTVLTVTPPSPTPPSLRTPTPMNM